MSLVRKLLPFTIGSVSIVGVGKYMSPWSTGLRVNSALLEKIYAISENIKDVSLTKDIDSKVENVSSPFLYSLMSSNLNTFSTSFKDHFYKWALFKWGDGLLKRTSNSIFVGPKISIFNNFVRLKNSYNPIFLTSKNWTSESNIITESKDVLEKAFEEVFFKKIYLKNDSPVAIDVSKEQFGGDQYIERVAEFQKFLYEEWKKKESPIVFCRKTWKYGSFGSSESATYKTDDAKIKLPSSPNFRFSDFHGSSESIKDFLKSLGTKGTCENNDFKIYTISEIAQNKDGWEVSAFLYRSSDEENKKPSSSEFKTDKNATDFQSKEPLELFISDASDLTQGSTKYPISLKSDILGDKGPLKDQKDKKILSFRDVKLNNDGYGTFVRTKEGLTYLYRKEDHNKDIDKFFFNNNELKKIGSNEDLLSILKGYWKSHSFELLGSYLADKDGKKNGGIFVDRSWDSSLYGLAENVSKFLSQLEKNKAHWSLLTTLSSAVSDFADIKFLPEAKQEAKQEATAGLAVPLQLSRNLNMNTELSEETWITEDTTNENDGDFPLLRTYLSQSRRKNLYETAGLIRENIQQYLNVLWVRTKKHDHTSYFLDDYIFDNIYHDFRSKQDLLRKTTSNIFLLNYLGFDFFKNDIQDFSAKLAEEVGGKEGLVNLVSLVKDSIIEIFYGSNYLSEKLEHRLNYGGYKYQKATDGNKKCEVTQSTADTFRLVASSSRDEDSECKKQQDNYRQKQHKLYHYWVDKNYFFNEYGYELGSEESTNYIRFLFALKWLVKDKFKAFREIGSSSITSNGYGALVWLDRVEQATEQAKKKMGESKDESKKTEIKDFEIYFKDNRKDIIFNPFFSRDIAIEAPDQNEHPLTTGNVTAFLKKNNKYVELAGYQGFVSEILNYKALPEKVSKALFDEFHKSNPKGNKSYYGDDQGGEGITGAAFGYSSGDMKNIDAETLIDSMSTLFSIKQFLTLYLPEEAEELLKWISDLDKDQLDSVDPVALTLDQAKQKAKEIVKKHEVNAKFRRSMSRFSGFLQAFEQDQSIFGQQKYFIAESTSSNKGHIAYVLQVNKYDFGSGFSSFVDLIGVRTLFKTAAMMALNDSAKASSTNTYLLKHGLVS